VLVLVVLVAADFDPPLRPKPGNDLTGIGLDRRHINLNMRNILRSYARM
jgi:hypothetical protein